MELLGHFGEGQSLIFVHTQQKCDQILKDLMLASYSVMSLHGGMLFFFAVIDSFSGLLVYTHSLFIISKPPSSFFPPYF